MVQVTHCARLTSKHGGIQMEEAVLDRLAAKSLEEVIIFVFDVMTPLLLQGVKRKGVQVMIDRVGTVSLFVHDQDRAKEFYTNVLGFELRADAALYPGASARWVAVAPPGAETEVILYLPDENWEHYKQVVGQSQALTFNVTDMQALHSDLKAKGVKFVQEPDKQPWGTFAIIEDSEGSRLVLVEQPKE